MPTSMVKEIENKIDLVKCFFIFVQQIDEEVHHEISP